MATSLMDFLGGGMFGGAGTYEDLLTEEQKRQMGQQSMMAMAAKLLQAGGPSDRPTSLGQALGGAYLTGQEAYEKAGAGAMNQMLTKQKIEEYRQQKTRDANWQNDLKRAASGVGGPAQDMTPVRQQGMPPIPGLMAPPPPQQPRQGGGMFGGLSPEQIALMGRMTTKDSQKAIFDNLNERSKAANKWSQPFSVMQGNTPVLMRQNELGATEVLPGATPYEASVSESRLLKEMGLPVNWENVTKLRQSAAGSTTNKIVMPPGQTTGREAVDKAFAPDYIQWVSGGGSDAVGNIAQIGMVLKQLETGKQLTGPAIGIQPDFVLALTNPTAANAKEQVQEVVQRNLRVVLGPQFTAKEGEALISRAYNPALPPEQNAARLRKLFEQMEIAAKARTEMATYFEDKGTLTGYKGPRVNINKFYEALAIGGSDRSVGSVNPAAKYFE